jgi:hypothetical protein
MALQAHTAAPMISVISGKVFKGFGFPITATSCDDGDLGDSRFPTPALL